MTTEPDPGQERPQTDDPAGHDESWCGAPKNAPYSLIVCTLSPGHDGEHIAADAWGKTITTWPRAEVTAASRPSLRETSSGRSEPHPAAAPAHDLTWRPEIDQTDHDAAYWAPLIVVECEPCGWRRTLTGTYTTGQLDRLDAMHCGDAL